MNDEIKEYLKKNLSIRVSSPHSWESTYYVELLLDNEVISSDALSLYDCSYYIRQITGTGSNEY